MGSSPTSGITPGRGQAQRRQRREAPGGADQVGADHVADEVPLEHGDAEADREREAGAGQRGRPL
ncbi:MAG TPA: hypothetical protein VFB52_02990 [Solirubrobacterales bacterium]|nr:hypothetical protein [Solirubrobacterales bacterium]